MVGINKKQLLEYYSMKKTENYFSTNYYQSITELINQMIRVRIIKRFFKKSLKQNENSKVLDLGCGDAKDIF
ncbi:MAG: hypothetical protein KJ767_00040, partial [Nanoarchaeota archaeon]|nr:hypothetical protein [Nanoarchaeota archaeon]